MRSANNSLADESFMSDNKASKAKLGYVGSVPGSRDSNAWYTPAKYLDSVRKVLGGIDLDPFSSADANKVVNAKAFYTESDNALTKSWRGGKASKRRVWMNPPYSGKLCSQSVAKFLEEYCLGSFTEGIFVVNNATETKWFQEALKQASAICFTGHRISFWNSDGKALSGNTRGQAFFYFGANPKTFLNEFSKYGVTVVLKENK